ncbi:DUF7088 domain-containing protein [Anaeromassilibacillus sp. SJQ-5]
MIKDNGFENTSGNGELEDELLEALNKKGLLPTDEEAAADGETAGQGEAAEEAGPGEDAEDSAQPEEESLEEFLSEDAAEEEAPEQDGKAKGKKPKKSKMDSRRFRYGSMATAITAVVAVLVVVLNVVVSLLADRFPINIDLTQNKLFSLSDNSVEIAKSINKDVQVIVFGSEDLYKNPNMGSDYYQVEALYKEIYKALQQYTSYSGGKVTVKYEDLNLNPQLATQYNKYEVTSGDILLLCGDRYQKASFNDMYEISGDGYTQAQTVSSKVEVTLASRIKNVMRDTVQVVTAFVGHEEDEDTVSALKSIYEANGYEFKELNLASSEEIDANTVAGLIVGPTKDFTAEEIERLQKWLDNDGKLDRNLMVFADFQAECKNLYEFLNVEYGLEVTDNLVMETSLTRTYRYSGFYPYADTADTDFTKDLSGSANVLTPLTRQIVTHKENNSENSLYNVPIITFPESAKLMKIKDATDENASSEDDKSFAADAYPINGMAASVKWTYVDNEQVKTNVILSGSTQMILAASQANVKNENVLMSALGAMTGVVDDINVSTKSLERDTITFSDSTTLIVGLGVFTVGIPVIILIICLVVFLKRRHL